MKKVKRQIKKNLLIIVLILISIIPLFDLFHPGLPVTHDGQDHVARIANFYQNLTDGNKVPRWAPNLNWGYGHPILMFLYPVPSYISSFFYFLGFSLVDSVKIFFGLAFILSSIAMFVWLREIFDDYISVIGSVLYLYAPYRFVDLYVRGAIGEHAAFIFLPLIFYFLLKLSKKYSFWYLTLGSLSLAGLILSHNAIILMFLPLIFLYIFYLYFSAENKICLLSSVFCLLLLGFSLSAFFWMPAFFEGKYTLRNVVTTGGYIVHFVKPLDLIYGKWSYGGSGQFTVQIGIMNLIALFSSILYLLYFKVNNKIKNRDSYFVILLLAYSFFAIFLMLPYSNFVWQKIMILQNFQFPWRFLSVIVFTSSILGAFALKMLPKKMQIILGCFLIIVAIFLTKDYWRAKSYSQKPESFFTGIYYGTTDTGESSPIWSVRFMEKEPRKHLEVIEGKGIIKELNRESTKHEYKVIAGQKIKLRENTLYFPGWFVFVNGKKAEVEFQDQNNRGLITFYVPKGEDTVEIIFKETKLRMFADLISLFSMLGIGGLILFSVTVKKR